MKKLFLRLLIILLIVSCLFSCYAIKTKNWVFPNSKQKYLVRNLHKITDTVCLFWISFSDDKYIWYHDDNYIHLFIYDKVNVVKKICIESKNLTVDTSDFNKVFRYNVFTSSAEKGFEFALDGVGVSVYINGDNEEYETSVNIDIVMNTEYENTCCKKIKYDLMKILGSYKKDH